MESSETVYALADLVIDVGAFDPSTAVQVREYWDGPQDSLIDFVVPAFNEEERIVRNLESIVECSTETNVLVVLADGCTDDTLTVLLAWAASGGWAGRSTRRVIVASISDSVFETMSDSVGIALTSSPYIVEVQADMLIQHRGFDALLVKALTVRSDLIAVSGRGTERQHARIGGQRRLCWASRVLDRTARLWDQMRLRRASVYFPGRLAYYSTGRAGRLGSLIEMPAHLETPPRLYLGETVMRGPLAMKREYFERLGGFDTHRYFLGDDDHDLMWRAWSLRRYRCGYVPISFASPLSDGATRRVRDEAAEARFQVVRQHYLDAQRDAGVIGDSRPLGRFARRIVRVERESR